MQCAGVQAILTRVTCRSVLRTAGLGHKRGREGLGSAASCFSVPQFPTIAVWARVELTRSSSIR